MQCKRCKKHFEYEEHYGICPNCAYYNRPDGKDSMDLLTEEDRKRFEWADDYKEPKMSGEHQKLHKEYDIKRKPHRKTTSVKLNENNRAKKGLLVIVAVLFALGVAAVLASGAYEVINTVTVTQKMEEPAENGMTETEETVVETRKEGTPIEKLEMGDEIIVGESGRLVLDEARILDAESYAGMLPEDMQLIAVHVSWKRDIEEQMEVHMNEIYLKTANLFRESVSFAREEDTFNLKDIGIENPVVFSDMVWEDALDGEICFIAKKNQKELECYIPCWTNENINVMPERAYMVHMELQ